MTRTSDAFDNAGVTLVQFVVNNSVEQLSRAIQPLFTHLVPDHGANEFNSMEACIAYITSETKERVSVVINRQHP